MRDVDLNGFIRQCKITSPTCASIEIAKTAFALFQANYNWSKPLRSIGVRGAGLVPADTCIQLSLDGNEEHRERLQRLDSSVDELRRRYGYTSVQRATLYTDDRLGSINPKDDHLAHPVGFFNAG